MAKSEDTIHIFKIFLIFQNTNMSNMVEYDPDCHAATSLLNLAADMSSLQERSQSPHSDFELELPSHIVPRCSVLRPKPIISKVASQKGRMRSSFRKQQKRRHFKEKSESDNFF